MFCIECGNAAPDEARFCIKCGTKIDSPGAPGANLGANLGANSSSSPSPIASVVAGANPVAQPTSPMRQALAQKQSNGQVLAAVLLVVGGIGFVAFGKTKPFSFFNRVVAADAASEIIKKSLRSPSSFELVSERQVWTGKASDGKDAYIYHVEYDAQNGFGATIRGSTYVGYEMSGDQYEWKPGMALDSSPESMEPAVVEMIRQLNFEK